MDERDTARLLGLARLVLGAGLYLAPRQVTRMWTGSEDADFPVDLVARGMGARDIALGVGTLIALESGANPRGWLEAGALADAGDAIGTLAAWGDLPGLRRLLLLASEVGAALLGAQLAAALDD
ncbi:MAG: hypothetical protein QOG54_2741 [Actinomycetota bacterium]|nr:hypothetical protein [Actinomycetota bacterium]